MLCVNLLQAFYKGKYQNMKKEQIQRIIHAFYGKHYHIDTQMRFRFWMRMKEDKELKEEVLQEIWQQTPSAITKRTAFNLSRIQQHIAQEEKKPVAKHILSWQKYAATITLVIISSVVTLWVNSLLKPKPQMAFIEHFVPYGEYEQFVLPDSSTVWLNAGSILIYPEEFEAKDRSVYLTGEGRFQVAKNKEKPFIVHTQQLNVEALGTIFNVQAYPNKEKVSATLEEGSVCITSNAGSFQKHILKPNQQFSYSKLSEKFVVRDVDASEASMWKDGFLSFEDCKFGEIMAALERKYNVMIQYDQAKYKDRSFHVKFTPDESLEDALNIFSDLIENFHYRIEENVVFIH